MARVRVTDLDYELPEELIAQEPPVERDAGRLLVLDASGGRVFHRRVRDLPRLLPPSLWIVNDTRVIAARLSGHKSTGGRVELLLVERRSPPGRTERWLCLGRASKSLTAGTRVGIADGLVGEVTAREGPMVDVLLHAHEGTASDAVAAVGEVPLPPYVRRPPTLADRERYQTLFARHEGAVAAPTAGLHFSERLIADLAAQGHELATITLHVGPGTFAPVTVDDLKDHAMHAERFDIPAATSLAIDNARAEGRAVIAVGTTVVRTLEAAAEAGGRVRAGSGSTSLCIHPPYSFRVVDGALTNFHLPRSTLLALVMALAGVDAVRAAYREAIAERYRFFSYGDAMLVRPALQSNPTGRGRP
jgi:S-adenosylmethionine:tRNA ribosyltransferase-isomerase